VIPALARRDFGYGSGMISPNLLRFIVNIPKNASSFVHAWTSHYEWRANLHTIQEHRISEMIVILRDPMDRWISGIAQYIQGWILHARGGYDAEHGPDADQQFIDAVHFIDCYNTITERLIFDNLDRFDDHVWPQSEIIQGVLESKKRVYFYLDSDFEDRLSQYLGLPKVTGLDRNASAANNDNRLLQEFFRNELTQKPKLKQRVISRYQQDYDLIDRAFDGSHTR